MKKLNVVLITLLALIPQIVWGDVITNYGQYSLKDDGDNHTATFTLAFDKAGIIITDHVVYNNTVYTVTAIGEEAFKNCKDLLTLDIPSTVTDIHENAFNGAPIAKITVDTNNETYQAIDSVLFTKSSKTLICYPANKKTSKYTVTSDVYGIQQNAFKNCKYLQTLYFSNTLVSEGTIDFSTVKAYTDSKLSICYNGVAYYRNGDYWKVGNGNAGSGLVDGFSEDNITILNNVNRKKVNFITPNAFTGKTGIYTLTFAKNSTLHKDMSGVDFTSFDQELYVYARGICYVHVGAWGNGHFKVGTGANGTGFDTSTQTEYDSSVSIVESINGIAVTEIADKAFIGVQDIALTIPKSVVSLSTSAFVGIDYNARNQLLSITVEEENPKYKSYKGALYYYDNENIELITYPWNGTILTRSLTDWLPGVTAIGGDAFKNHRNLTSIEIPKTVKTIGQSAFQYVGYDMASLTVTFEEESQLTTIGTSAFQESKILSINLPNELTNIGASAFKQCVKLTEIILPASLSTIGSSAFQSCSNLTTVNLPASLTSIGYGAFQYCNKLTDIKFENKYEPGLEINDYAFYNCKLSNTVEVRPGVTKIGNHAFDWSDDFRTQGQMKTFRVPSSVTTYGDNVVYRTVKVQRKMELDFGANTYLTYYSPQNIGLSDGQNDVLKAYIITDINQDNTVETTPLNYIHKNQALLLELIKGKTLPEWYEVPNSETMEKDNGVDFTTNLLKGSATGIADMSTLAGDKYVLTADQFVKIHQDSLPAMRCYLSVDNGTTTTSNLYIKDDSSNTFIIMDEETLVNKNNYTSVGSASLVKDGTKMKLTVTPGNSGIYYANKGDITVKRNVTAKSGRAPAIDLTTYSLTVIGEDQDPDPSREITYHFTPTSKNDVYEVTVNFHKRTNISNTTATKVITLGAYDDKYNGEEKTPQVDSFIYNGELVASKNYRIKEYESNKNAGTGIARIEGQREYMGTYDKTFPISKRDINEVTVDPDTAYFHKNPFPFTGDSIKPNLTVKFAEIELVKGTDYDVTYDKNINVTTDAQPARINLVSKEKNYTGTQVVKFYINPKVMTAANIANIPDQAYTGSAIEPNLTFKDDGDVEIILKKGTDYDVTYDNNIDPGVAKAIVNFKGNYAGEEVEKTFIIKDHPQTITVNFDNPNNQWTTYYSKDNLTLSDGLKAYVVTGRNDMTVVTEEVTFIPKETAVLLYSESGEKEFNLHTCYSAQLSDGITPANNLFKGTLDGLNISTVNGTKFVLINGKFIQTAEGTLDAHRCYLVVTDPIEVGTLTIGKTDDIIYQENGAVTTTSIGTASKSVPVDGVVTLTVKPNKGFYVETGDITVVRNTNAGKGRAQQIDNGTVTVKSGTITDDVDNNTSTYLFTYPVENECQYQVTVNFHKAANFQETGKQPIIAFNEAVVYNGTEQKAEPIVTTYDGNKLTKDVDYKLVYPDADYTLAANGKKVSVIGIRKYVNGLDRTFNIDKRDISLVTFIAKEGQTWISEHTPADETPQVVFTGSAIELDITDIVNDKNILTVDEATITYTNNTNADDASVTIKSKGINYQGEKTFNYTIVAKEMTAENIATISDQKYTGNVIEPDLTIMFGKIELVKGTDYDVTYTDNIKAGTATATVNFKGNYAGKNVKKTFKIEEVKETLAFNFDEKNEWTTYYASMNLTVVDGLKAYVVTSLDGKKVIPHEIDFIPKEVPVLLHRIGNETSFEVMSCSTKEMPADIKPSPKFKGAKNNIVISEADGITRFVLFNNEFVQTKTGTLEKGHCYIEVSDAIPGVSTLAIGKGVSAIICQEEGTETTSIGSATVSSEPDKDNNMTLTIKPISGFYADKEDITVAYSTNAGKSRAPEIGGGKVELNPVAGYSDTGKEYKYTFPYTEGYYYQITVNFHKCINFQTKETQPVITLEDGIYVYDGTVKEPKVTSVTITMSDGTVMDLKENTDFAVKYGDDNINAGGNAQVIITGMNHYTSEFNKNFNISQRNIKNDNIKVDAIANQTYTGNAIEPTVVVKDIVKIGDNNVELLNRIEGKPDYTLEFLDNVHVGTATVNIKANSINYTGVKTAAVTFNILPKDLSAEGNKPIIDAIPDQIYTGNPIKPVLIIKDGELVIDASNYDVKYTNNIAEGTATADITFKNDYKGTASTTFNITYKKETKKLNVVFGEKDEWTTYYSPIDLQHVEGVDIFIVTGLNSGEALKLETEVIDFIPKNIGVLLKRADKIKTEFYGETMSSTTKLEGVTPNTDLFRGSATGIEDIKTIEGIKYFLKNDNFIQVVEGPLPANRCYVFINNDNDEGINHVEGDNADGIIIQEEGKSSKTAGTVSVSGVSSDGYKTITVTPASVCYATKDEIKVVRSLKNETPTASASHRVPGIENFTVEVIPKDAMADPSGKTEYKFKYESNYHYQVTVNFHKRIDLSKPAVYNPVVTLKSEDIQNLVYDGKEKTPNVVSVTCNGTIVDSSNYTISYENNVNAGKPRVIITGKRFLIGSTHAEFSIGKRDFSNVTVELPIPDQEYTGNAIIPTNIVVKDIVDGKNIASADDYELICENNIEVGTAKVSLAPRRNYYGTNKDFFFKIIPATGINQITIDAPEGKWFDMSGRRIEKRPTQKGVYILRDKNNKTLKVRIK